MSRFPEAVSVALKRQIRDKLESRLKVPGNASMFPSANAANMQGNCMNANVVDLLK